MIYTSFVHAEDESYFIESTCQEAMFEVDAIMGKLYTEETQLKDMKALGIFTESMDEIYLESVKDAVSNLGKKIMEIIQSFVNMIKSARDKMKSWAWKQKDVDKKFAKIAKDRPELIDKIKVKVNEGSLDFNSFKDLNDFYQNIDEVLDNLNKRDPKTLMGKLDAITDKLTKKSAKEKIETITKIAGLTGTIVTIGFNIHKWRKSKLEGICGEGKTISERAEKTIERLRLQNVQLDRIINGSPGTDTTIPIKRALLAKAAASVNSVTHLNVSKREHVMTTMLDGFSRGYNAIFARNSEQESRVQNKRVEKARRAKEKNEMEISRLEAVSRFNRGGNNRGGNRRL